MSIIGYSHWSSSYFLCSIYIAPTTPASAMLIKQYTAFLEHTTTDLVLELDHAVLKRIIFTKRISLICCGFYSMDLGVFIIVYNHYTAHIMSYLSISWCISAFLFSLNFKRNSHFWKRHLLQCKNDTIVRTVSDRLGTIHLRPRQPRLRAPPTTPIDRSTTNTKPKLDLAAIFVGALDEYRSFDEEQDCNTQAGGIISQSANVDTRIYDANKIYGAPSLKRALTDPLMLEHGNENLSIVGASEEISASYIMPTNIKRTTSANTAIVRRISKAKALDVLGLAHSLQSQNMNKHANLSQVLTSVPTLHDEEKDVGIKDNGNSFTERLSNITPLPLDIKPTVLGEEIFNDINDLIFDIPDSMEQNSSTGSGLYMKSTGDIVNVDRKLKIGNVQSDNMFMSFNIFAKQGFCSQEDVNSVKELSKYTESVFGNSEEQIVYPSTYGKMLSVVSPFE
eukprot:978259_1